MWRTVADCGVIVHWKCKEKRTAGLPHCILTGGRNLIFYTRFILEEGLRLTTLLIDLCQSRPGISVIFGDVLQAPRLEGLGMQPCQHRAVRKKRITGGSGSFPSSEVAWLLSGRHGAVAGCMTEDRR